MGNFCALAVSSLFVDFLPFQPVQILLLNFVTDFTMLGFAGDTVDSEELAKPSFFDIPWLLVMVIVFGFVSSLLIFGCFTCFLMIHHHICRHIGLLAAYVTELVFIYSIRSKRALWRATRPATLIALTALAGVLAFVLPVTSFGQTYFDFISPSWSGISKILMVVCVFFVVIECAKMVLYSWKDKIKKLIKIGEVKTLQERL